MNSKQNPIQKVKFPDLDEFSDENLGEYLTNVHRLKRGLIIHAEIYIMLIVIAVAVSIFITNFILLFFNIIGALIWFIGLGEHIVAYRMKSREVYPKSKRGFYYHLGAFLSSIPLMVLATMFVFVFIPLLIWGSIILAHYILYKLMDSNLILKKVESSNYDTTPKYGGFSEGHLRALAIKKVRFRISVEVHAIIYFSSLFMINFFTFWSFGLYLLFGSWLILLGEHLTAYLTFSRGVYPKAKRILYFHLATYVFSLPLWLIVIPIFWIIVGSWGILLLIHYALFQFIYYVIHRNSRNIKRPKKSHIQRLVEKEMEKMKREL